MRIVSRGKIYHNRWLEKLSTAYHSQIVRLMEKPRLVIVPLLAILLGSGDFKLYRRKRLLASVG